MIVLLRLLLAFLTALLPAAAPVTEPPLRGYGLAQPVQSEPAEDASSITFEGILAYAAPSHGPLYLAIRQPRGTRVEVCGPASCLTRVSTDFGPTLEMARQGRIADLSATDFERVCGMSAAELFAAYRNASGWETECECGDRIYSQVGTPAGIEEAVKLHQESTVHAQWRAWQEAVMALKRPTRRHCPCHEHGAA